MKRVPLKRGRRGGATVSEHPFDDIFKQLGIQPPQYDNAENYAKRFQIVSLYPPTDSFCGGTAITIQHLSNQ